MSGGRFWSLFLIVLMAALTAGPGLAAERQPKVVMLGDSLTAGCDWAAHWPQLAVDNQGVSGDTTGMILARLDRVIAAEPDLIFLQAGINDFGRQQKETIILDNHRAIWQKLRTELPGVKIYVISLLPVSERGYPRMNNKIREFNQLLKNEADRQGLTFIDLFPQLTDENGQLPPKFTYDGLHLTTPAYAVWLAALGPYLQRSEQ